MNPTNLVGQLRPIAFFKGLEVAGLALFSVLAPRYLGPELFGRFAVVLSLTTLWIMASNLGARYVFGRFVPEYASNGATHHVRALFMHMVGSRLLLAAVGTPLFVLFLHRALPEASTLTLGIAAGAFVAMTTSAPMFSIFFGFNQLGVSMGREAFGRLALLAMLFLIGARAGLERATASMLITQTGALLTGIYLCRELFLFDRSAFEWRAVIFHLRFGIAVFAANLLLRVPWRLGEAALALADIARPEIAFFNIALSIPVAFTRLLGGLTTLQIPELSLKHAAGDGGGRDRNLGLALKYLNVASVLFVLGIFTAGPWAVRHLWGARFVGVIPLLLLAAPTTLSQPFVRTALSLAVVESRLLRNLELGLASVAAFVPAAWWLIPRYGARGAAAALLAASFASAGLGIARLRPTGVLVAARTGRHLLAAALPAAILLGGGGAPLAAIAAALIYLGLLFGLGVVHRSEFAPLREQIRLRRRRPAVS